MMNRREVLLKAKENITKEHAKNGGDNAKNGRNNKKILRVLTSKKLEKLKSEFPKISVKEKSMEKYVYAAASFYPELKTAKITFKEMNFGLVAHPIFMAAARFKIMSIVTGRRHYVILLNNKYRKTLVNNFAFESTVYLIAHELSHILDYENKSRLDLLKFGAKYLVPKHRKLTEFETDIRVIHRGLDKHMVCYLDDLNNSEKVPKRFKKFRNKSYIRKDDIIKIIKK
jgi:hypothetical protein